MNPLTVFRRLSPAQRVALGALFLLSYAISFLWWRENGQRHLQLEEFRAWEFRGYVLYDGYGNFAERLHDAMVHPGAESFDRLGEFSRGYLHLIRPVFPALIATLNLAFRDILLSAIVANLLASLLCVWAFNLLLTRHFDFGAPAQFRLNALLLAHVGVVGMLARPMADALALFWLLLAFHAALDWEASRRWRDLGVLSLVVALGILTKTASVLVLLALPLGLARFGGGSRGQVALRLGGALLGGAALIAGVLGLAKLLFADHQAVVFLFQVVRGPFENPPDAAYLKVYGRAAVLFLALALQVHPLFWGGNRRVLEPRFRLLLAWVLVYVAQRFVFSGFNLFHSRARYGIPLVPAALLLAWPGIERWLEGRRADALVVALIVANYAMWLPAFLGE